MMAAIGISVVLFRGQTTTMADKVDIVLQLLWAVGSAVVDASITIYMAIFLYNTRASTYSGEIHDRLSRLLRLTIQTGFMTSLLAVLVIPLYLENTFLYAIPLYLLGKSYNIALLANLNARS